MTGPVRVGIIGANYGAGTHIPAYRHVHGIEVVAVCTSRRATAERAAAEHRIPHAFWNYEDMTASPDVDLVDIATRPRLHHPMAMAALRNGKHVLCEAPLALDTREGQEMAETARAQGVVAVVDMQSRYAPALGELHRLVRDGFLGRVEFVDVTAFYPTFTRPQAIASSGWCAQRSNGATSLRVHALHSADIVRWCFGEIDSVVGVAANLRSRWESPDGEVAADSDDHAAFVGRLAGGAIVNVRSSWVAHHETGFRLAAHGSDGTLVATAAGHTSHFPVSLHGARAGQPLEPLPAPAGMAGPTAAGASNEAFARLATRLVAAVTTGEPIEPSFDDGLQMLRLAEAVERSAATGSWQRLPGR